MKTKLLGLVLVTSLFAGMFAGSAAPAQADPYSCLQNTYPCQRTVVAASSPGTNVLVTGSTVLNTYVFKTVFESTGVNSANFINFLIGQGGSCATNPLPSLFASPIAPGTANGEWLVGWGQGYGNGVSSVTGLSGSDNQPLLIPANATPYNLCGQSTGTTTVGSYTTYYIQLPF